MSNYTMQLREVINLYGYDEVKSWFTSYNLEDFLTSKQIEVIQKTGMWSKEKLATKIINHYFMREIGLETCALFRHFVKFKMNEIMESMLPYIYTVSVDYDPFVNENYTEEYTSEGDSLGTSESSAKNSGLGVNSDTPQGQINKSKILEGEYASSVNASESESTGGTLSTGKSTSKYTRHVEGNRGVSSSYQILIDLFRKI